MGASMLFWQFFELCVVLMAAIEEVVALIFYCQELFFFLFLFDNGLQQVLLDCVIHEDIQLFFHCLVLELGHVDVDYAFHHFCDDFSGVSHYLG